MTTQTYDAIRREYLTIPRADYLARALWLADKHDSGIQSSRDAIALIEDAGVTCVNDILLAPDRMPSGQEEEALSRIRRRKTT